MRLNRAQILVSSEFLNLPGLQSNINITEDLNMTQTFLLKTSHLTQHLRDRQ